MQEVHAAAWAAVPELHAEEERKGIRFRQTGEHAAQEARSGRGPAHLVRRLVHAGRWWGNRAGLLLSSPSSSCMWPPSAPMAAGGALSTASLPPAEVIARGVSQTWMLHLMAAAGWAVRGCCSPLLLGLMYPRAALQEGPAAAGRPAPTLQHASCAWTCHGLVVMPEYCSASACWHRLDTRFTVHPAACMLK